MNKDQVKGKVRENTGNLLNDDEMELEGHVEKKMSKIKRGFGDIKDDIKKRKIKRDGLRSSFLADSSSRHS